VNTFLLCSGIHGEERGLDTFRRLVDGRQPDGILFAGGVLAVGRCYEPKVTLWGMTREDAIFVERFFETLDELNVFSAVIPGRSDTPLDEFLRLGMNAEVEFPSVHVVHATVVTRNGMAVAGLGGWVSDGSAYELDCCSRTLAQYYVRSLAAATQPHKVLLLPRPPGVAGIPGGSLVSAELIDSLHPHLCLAGDGIDTPSVQRVAHTLVVCPGFLADGRAAWLDWRRPAGERVELLDAARMRAASPRAAGQPRGAGKARR
jgi:Icc-related predicted phosphoesterase